MLTYYLQGRRITLQFRQMSEILPSGSDDPVHVEDEVINRLERETHAFWPTFLPGHFAQRGVQVRIPANPVIFRRYNERGGVRYIDVRTQNLGMSQFPDSFDGLSVFGINTFVPNESDTIEVHVLVQKQVR